jgi:hypothetical protein
LLKIATALKLTYQEALEYGFITVSNNPAVLKALVVVWNVGKRNPIPPTDGRRGKRKKRSKRK